MAGLHAAQRSLGSVPASVEISNSVTCCQRIAHVFCQCLAHIQPMYVAPMRSRVLVVMQRDITERAHMEKVMSELMQAQLSMLCQIFPR